MHVLKDAIETIDAEKRKCDEKQVQELIQAIKKRKERIKMAENKPQIVISFKQGDHGVFDLEGGETAFKDIHGALEDPNNLFLHVANAIFRMDSIERLFFFPEGYQPPVVPPQATATAS